MTTKRSGRCLCGRITYEVDGPIEAIEYCHCSRCRRASGSAFSANGSIRKSRFRLLTGAQDVGEFESPAGKFRAFCVHCGSPLYSRLDRLPDRLRLRLGTMDDDPGGRARAHIFVGSKASWFDITDEIPQHEENSPS